MSKNETLEDFSISLRRAGMSQAWAARKMEISAQHLTRVLSGKNEPSIDLLEKMNELSAKLKSSGLAAV